MSSKILVVCYSRTGTTKKLAEQLAKTLKADIDMIVDEKDRKGIFGYLSGGGDAWKKRLTKIKFIKNPEKYSLVIVGTPVWAGAVSPAVRTYLSNNKLKKVGFFCTSGSGNESKTFSEMQNLSSKPVATLSLKTKEVIQNLSQEKILAFIEKLK